MKSFITFLIALAIFSSLLPSCKKTADNPNSLTFDSATIMGFKDSTQLVKSFSIQYYDSTGNMDALNPPNYLYYDTLNKKIYFTAIPVTVPPTSNFIVLSYNNAGLITSQTYNSLSTDPGETISSVFFSYDEQNVFKSTIYKYKDGTSDTTSMIKTNLPSGGYSLSNETLNPGYDSSLFTLNFNVDGSVVSESILFGTDFNEGYDDSVLYDASGNVSKVIRTHLQGPLSTSTYNLFEFTARDTKGEQLSNFNKILFNGVANLPSGPDISSGNLISGLDNYYFYQFTKYPSLSTKVYRESSGLYIKFNPSAQFDSKGRLVKYKMYNGDVDFNYAAEYDLTYYK